MVGPEAPASLKLAPVRGFFWGVPPAAARFGDWPPGEPACSGFGFILWKMVLPVPLLAAPRKPRGREENVLGMGGFRRFFTGLLEACAGRIPGGPPGKTRRMFSPLVAGCRRNGRSLCTLPGSGARQKCSSRFSLKPSPLSARCSNGHGRRLRACSAGGFFAQKRGARNSAGMF